MHIAPSILSANFATLENQILETKATCPYIHFDVMDGVFVPNISFGPKILGDIKKITPQTMDVHLMIVEPHKYFESFAKAGADILTFHYEAYETEEELSKHIKSIKALNMKAGLSIKPGTDVKVLDKFLDDLDNILIMSVEPGFGGQSFMDNCIDKIKYLAKLKKEKNFTITVDGGINETTAKLVALAGVDIAVAGSFIFNNKLSIPEAIELIRCKDIV